MGKHCTTDTLLSSNCESPSLSDNYKQCRLRSLLFSTDLFFVPLSDATLFLAIFKHNQKTNVGVGMAEAVFDSTFNSIQNQLMQNVNISNIIRALITLWVACLKTQPYKCITLSSHSITGHPHQISNNPKNHLQSSSPLQHPPFLHPYHFFFLSILIAICLITV